MAGSTRNLDGLTVRLVRCAECEAESDEQARGWRALTGEEDDGSLMTAVYCPTCAAKEAARPRSPRNLVTGC